MPQSSLAVSQASTRCFSRSSAPGALRPLLQMVRKPFEHAPRGCAISRAHVGESLGNRRFNRPATHRVGSRASRRQSKHRAPAVEGVVATGEEALIHQSLQYAR